MSSVFENIFIDILLVDRILSTLSTSGQNKKTVYTLYQAVHTVYITVYTDILYGGQSGQKIL